MKTNDLTFGTTGGNFPCELVLIQISVVLQLVINTCGLEDISKPKHKCQYEFINNYLI